MAKTHRDTIRAAKRQMRRLEARIESITLTYGTDPEDASVMATLTKLCDEWTNLRFAIANARAAAKATTGV